MADLWENDDPVSSLGIEVPPWIDDDITCADVAAVVQGGCSSGAYMPAVTYWKAVETMGEHSDDVLQFIEDALGELPWPNCDTSWGGIACHFLSYAVELWCCGVEDEIDGILDEMEDDDE